MSRSTQPPDPIDAERPETPDELDVADPPVYQVPECLRAVSVALFADHDARVRGEVPPAAFAGARGAGCEEPAVFLDGCFDHGISSMVIL